MNVVELKTSFQNIRNVTEQLCAPLITEDYVIQGMEDVSPPKWHLAHSTWFFETCILKQNPQYKVHAPIFHELFNSYYQLLGKPFPRARRGLLARPSVKEIYEYRQAVDEHILSYLENEILDNELLKLLELGLHHEQQHQELLLMDIKFNFSLNPLFPVYCPNQLIIPNQSTIPIEYLPIDECITTIGAEDNLFCFDNELPQHKAVISSCAIANRLINNEEYLAFIKEGGYQNPGLWLSDGWDWRVQNEITHPLYWSQLDNEWFEFTLYGLQPLCLNAPVAHVNFYEADAFARWSNARLPTEEEWEHHVIRSKYTPEVGNFLEQNNLIPLPVEKGNNAHQFYGDLWEWTSSAYAPYPNYQPLKGMVGEYNGKFMNNQRVLKGGSCITPQKHIRATYRNFFQPEKRWSFCGIRLIKNDLRRKKWGQN